VVAEKPSAQPQATVGTSGLQAKIPAPADVGPKQKKRSGSSNNWVIHYYKRFVIEGVISCNSG